TVTSRLARHYLDDQRLIDIHRLHRARALPPGTTTTWQWSDGFVMVVRAELARLALTIDGGFEQAVRLARRTGTLGGQVVLFHCPRCESRRWHLYLGGGAVACRGCLGLRYASRHTWWAPSLVRARRLRRRLGADLMPFSLLPPRAPRRGWAALMYDRITA